MRETDTHIYFWDGFLSNFYICELKENGIVYNSSECYFMAKKAETFKDFDSLDKILLAKTPYKQKSLGKKIKAFDEKIWEEVRFQIMVDGLALKFGQNQDLKKMLLDTSCKVLVEGSPYDKIWGVGIHYLDDSILDENNWNGLNLLGKALMIVRESIKFKDLK